MKSRVFLTLADGSIWSGIGENITPTEGEVVFTTAFCGYPQTLTDPSYCGQIVVFAFPPIGVYGVDEERLEGRRVWLAGALAGKLDETESGRFDKLSSWMARSNVPLIEGIDTRALILKIRERGSMMGRIDYQPIMPTLKELPHDMVTKVSVKEIEFAGEGETTVGLIDYGVKENIIRSFVSRGCRVIRFPNTAAASEIMSYNIEGLILSNGPGDPAVLDNESRTVFSLLGRVPILGVCLGNQLLARACGASTKKLDFGHRGANQPVINLQNGLGLQTSQNHQYAVDEASLGGTGLEVVYRHLGDGTVEGLLHKGYGAASVQFHPEASPGPEDASYIFDNFTARIKAVKEA